MVIAGTGITTLEMFPLHPQAFPENITLQLTDNNLVCDCDVAWTKLLPWRVSVVHCAIPSHSYDNPVTADFFAHCEDHTKPPPGSECGQALSDCEYISHSPCEMKCGVNGHLFPENELLIRKTIPKDKKVNLLLLYYLRMKSLPVNFLRDVKIVELQIHQSTLEVLANYTIKCEVEKLRFINNRFLEYVDEFAFFHLKMLVELEIKYAHRLLSLGVITVELSNLALFAISSTNLTLIPRPKTNPLRTADELAIELLDNRLECNCSMVWLLAETWLEVKFDCENPPRKHDSNPITDAADFKCPPPSEGFVKTSFGAIVIIFFIHPIMYLLVA